MHPLTDALPDYLDALALRQACGEIEERLTRERDEARTKRLETLANVADERDALRAKFERLRSVIPSLIVVQRMPNAEHVADAHNDAVRVLRAALREPTP